jgi:urease accessory protein
MGEEMRERDGEERSRRAPGWAAGWGFLAALAVILLPAMAFAHQETGSITGIVSGLKHPVSGMDHVLAMISVGLWGAQLGAPAVWMLPVAFPMVMAFGGMLGLMGIALPGIEIGIAVSALVLGAMILTESRPPLWFAAALVGFFAIFHGHAHGTELPVGSSGLLYSIGFVAATGTLHGLGIALGLVHRFRGGRLAVRAAGGVVSAAGVFFLVRIFA